ncbi:DUF2752 domain-containing protein [Gemmatimonadota bacterium]
MSIEGLLSSVGLGLLNGGCFFFEVVGIPCPLCGMTRSFLSLLAMDLGGAFAYHPAGPILFFLVAYTMAALVMRPKLYARIIHHTRNNIIHLTLLLWLVNVLAKSVWA